MTYRGTGRTCTETVPNEDRISQYLVQRVEHVKITLLSPLYTTLATRVELRYSLLVVQ